MTIGLVVRRRREALGMDQVTLAKRAGVSQQGVSKIERGLSTEPKSLPRICKVLGVTVDELLDEAGVDPMTLKPPPSRVGQRATSPNRSPRARWPFLLPYWRFERLTHAQKLHIEARLIEEIAKIETSATRAAATSTARAKPRH